MDEYIAKLIAKRFYLIELQKSNLITPSIARPYPVNPDNPESMILHSSYRKIQQRRIDVLEKEIESLRKRRVHICNETLISNKERLRNKIGHLERKFNPDSVKKMNVKLKRRNNNRSNKKSRERYRARRYREKLREYMSKESSKTVYNLSSIDIPVEDLFALELGHGFVPAPNNTKLKEETLVLEGFRFIDRLCSIDNRLSEKKNKDNDTSGANDTDTSPSASTTVDSNETGFERNGTVPHTLTFSQPKEENLSLNETKMIKTEFTNLNNKILNNLQSNNTTQFNLPKKARESIIRLKALVKEKKIDIRKVDKGQMLLIIDYAQRLATEELNITKVSSLCDLQASNWLENKEYSENIMKELFSEKFIEKCELTAVTGLLAGGITGKLKHGDGSLKFTRVIANAELFTKQSTPYVYPLFKVHKLSIQQLTQIASHEVATKIPSRLVAGMGNCQLGRVQIWLEHFLTPLSKLYGNFEYIKDTNDFLVNIEKVKDRATSENWNWDSYVLFAIDVKALYPSIKFEHLTTALHHCFDSCTQWSHTVKTLLIDLIIYTLKNQQVYWNSRYYILDQGIPTGGKHSVPLANILLCFILVHALNNHAEFCRLFKLNVSLWKRFIDDCSGIYKGTIVEFLQWYTLLQFIFKNYALELTCDTDRYIINDKNEHFEKEEKGITFLDIDIFKSDGTIHTKEHRKETSVNSYLHFQSAHPRHTFAGIIKSQLYRVRKLCSREIDYKEAVLNLKTRCVNSGYNVSLINSILGEAKNIQRNLEYTNIKPLLDEKENLRLVILSGTKYQNEFKKFAQQMNSLVKDINIQIVMSTGPTLGRLLFNNNDKVIGSDKLCGQNCLICRNGLQDKSGEVVSSVTGIKYNVERNLSCNNGGIYVVKGSCNSQYSGKTIHFGTRGKEHLETSKSTAIYHHKQKCNQCNTVKDFDITFVENYLNKGKYSLSEREFFWNNRIKGVINKQKTLKSD